MNKRQSKKLVLSYDMKKIPYNTKKKMNRKSHEESIKLARREHRNFWEEWKKGYPNRFPYMKWFEYKNQAQ